MARQEELQAEASATTTPTVVRTERGLTVSGTRITIYDVMDYVTAGWPPTLIRDRLNLSAEQIADVMAYIERHRPDVDAEYERVLRTAAANRKYWEERNRERFKRPGTSPSGPGREELRAKLRAWKNRLERAE